MRLFYKAKERVETSIVNLIKSSYLVHPLMVSSKHSKNKLVIFYFHGIYESEAQKALNHVDPQNNLTIAQFEELIEYFLQYKYQFIKPEDLSERLPNDKAYIMLTFDDGYFNNTLAIDVLNKYKLPATFFITTKNVLNNTSYWWDIIYKYRLKEGKSLETIRAEQIYLKSFKHTFIESYIKENFGCESFKPWSDIDRPLTTNELKDIAANPYVTIGNHTCNHSILTNCNRQEIRDELSSSNETLYTITGIRPQTVAFPNGNFNSEILDVTKELGFQAAFTIIKKLNILPDINVKDQFVCLNRFMAQPVSIKKYGSLNRLGYTPESLYADIKKKLLFFK